MGTFDNAREVLEELNAMALESDCGLVDTPQARAEAARRIARRRAASREKAERDASRERDVYNTQARWFYLSVSHVEKDE